MKLSDLSTEERKRLAEKIGSSPKYIDQLAYETPCSKTGAPRRPSVALARLLVEADRRLTLSDLRPDVWPKRGAASVAGKKPARTAVA